MNPTDFYFKLDEMLELDPGTLKGGEALESLEGWDSVAVISLIALADSDYGVTLPPKEIAGCKTVNDLLDLVSRLVTAAAN